jgi:ABC-type dipeptide/oligopeptide/nickel transport system permease subunit
VDQGIQQQRREIVINTRSELVKLKINTLLANLSSVVSKLRRKPMAMLGFGVVALFVVCAILAPAITSYPPDEVSLQDRFLPPLSPGHVFGTDHLGRDLFTRIVYGARVSILVGVITIAISLFIGGVLGILAGYYGGRLDAVLSRLTELLLAFPYLIFSIGAMAMLGPGFWNLICSFVLPVLASWQRRQKNMLPPQSYWEGQTWRSWCLKSCLT